MGRAGRAAPRSGNGVQALEPGELRPGVAFEKTWDAGWYVFAIASFGLRVPTWADGRDVALAPRGLVATMGGHTWRSGTSIGLGALFEAEGAPSVDGVEASDARRRRTGALAFAAHDVTQRWTMLGSVVVDLPVDAVGKNDSPGIAASIGMRYAWRRHD